RLVDVILEFRDLAGTLHRLALHDEWRLDLDVAVLARVHVEHEIDQPARQPGAEADQDGKARARHLGPTLQVEDAEGRADLPVRFAPARRRLAPRAHD